MRPAPPGQLIRINIHPAYLSLQKRAIHAVFTKLDIPYIPAYLIDLLEQYDARHALFLFAQRWNISYRGLMDPEDPLHVKQREELAYAVGFLIEVEETAKAVRLDPTPIYDALNKSVSDAEQRLDNLRRVAHLAQQLRTSRLTFAPIKQLVANTLDTLLEWHTLTGEFINQATDTARRLASYEAQFGTADQRINDALQRLQRARIPDDLKHEYHTLVARRTRILHDLGTATLLAFEGILNDFSSLAEHFESLAQRAKADTYSRTWARRRGGLSLEDAYAILKLAVGASIIEVKKAYRRLALQCHPDRNSNDLGAKEAFQQLLAAYQLVMSTIGSSG